MGRTLIQLAIILALLGVALHLGSTFQKWMEYSFDLGPNALYTFLMVWSAVCGGIALLWIIRISRGE
jgi:hypothetical protein